MNFRIHNFVEQQVGAHIALLRLHDGGQINYRFKSETAARSDCLHRMVGLSCAVGEHIFSLLPQSVADKVLKLAYLIAAKKVHTGKIITLDVKLYAQVPGKVVKPVKRRGIKAKLSTRLCGKQLLYFFIRNTHVIAPYQKLYRV